VQGCATRDNDETAQLGTGVQPSHNNKHQARLLALPEILIPRRNLHTVEKTKNIGFKAVQR